jgi:hypothetical protein
MASSKRRALLAAMRLATPFGSAAGIMLGFGFLAVPAAAQDSPAVQCIAAAQEKLGNLTFLRAACATRQDCTYQAPVGNASALAVLNGAVDTVEGCWRTAGLTQTDEQRERQGVIRTYAKPGETCKLLLAMTLGTMADGFRVACQSETPR